MTRLLYELCCLRDPAQSMGLGAGESIHVVPISRTTQQARRIVFGGIASKMALAPWWRGRYKETLDYIEFPDKKITIVGGASSDAAALGLNVYTALVDEGNFMGQVKASEAAKSAGGKTHDRAQMICDALVRRIQGTYRHSAVKGMLFLISSKRATEDFTERRIREHIKQGTTQGVFVRDYATWHVRPEPFKNQKWYRCSVSSAEGRCRILSEDETAPKDALVFTFPEDFKTEFERDPAGCFTGDTQISLLDGSEIAIKDLVGREEFWVYSFTPEGLFRPGRGHSARLTKKNAPIVEVELDNGKRIRCTPDHRFMLRDGSYLPAMALTPGVSLMPLYRKTDKYGYEMLQVNTGSGRWMHTHRLVALAKHLECSPPAIASWLKRRGLPTYSSLLKDPLLREQSFTDSAPGNHKVVAIHLLGETADVYDLTVDVTHNFALSSGICVKNSTRDIAGIATDTYAPFVADRKAIERMFDKHRPQVFGSREWDMGMGPLTINWDDVITLNGRNEHVPMCCPNAMRHVHIDLSRNMCATGFCLIHQAGIVEIVRTDASGKKSIEEAPVFHIDGMLRVIAGSANEIDHSEVRGLIYRLNEGGFNIRSVGLDHWMSVPNTQILQKQGYRVKEISTVKKIDPFDTARSALYEGRIVCPTHDKLADEIRSLELDPRRPHDRPKVIVQHNHSKDLADAWAAGVYYIATNATSGTVLAPSRGGSIGGDSVAAKSSGRGATHQWSSGGEIQFTDETGYENWKDDKGMGGSGAGDAHEQAWII